MTNEMKRMAIVTTGKNTAGFYDTEVEKNLCEIGLHPCEYLESDIKDTESRSVMAANYKFKLWFGLTAGIKKLINAYLKQDHTAEYCAIAELSHFIDSDRSFTWNVMNVSGSSNKYFDTRDKNEANELVVDLLSSIKVDLYNLELSM